MRTNPKASARSCDSLLSNQFDRFDLGGGVFGWVYVFRNRGVLPIPRHVAGSYEVAVQLEGEWAVSSWGRPVVVARAGDAFTVPGGTSHTYEFRAGLRPGIQVGFAVRPQELEARPPGLLRWSRDRLAGPARDGLREVAQCVAAWRTGAHGAAHVDRGRLRARVLELVTGELDLEPASGYATARMALEQHLEHPLYLRHIAEASRMHEKTLSRAFVERLGVPPIRFRTEMRIQAAIRRLWSQPELAVAKAAQEVGFDSARFFHRIVRATFGMTPAELARRPAARRETAVSVSAPV